MSEGLWVQKKRKEKEHDVKYMSNKKNYYFLFEDVGFPPGLFISSPHVFSYVPVFHCMWPIFVL
jgi:hypothetical protein